MSIAPAPQVEMVSELQRLSDAATPGPWETLEDYQGHPLGNEWSIYSPSCADEDYTGWIAGPDGGDGIATTGCPGHRQDAEFIVALVNWFRDNQAALNARAGGDGWLPIESAPKDGRGVFAFWGTNTRVDEQSYGVAVFVGGDWCNADNTNDIYGEPTHWQPLPTPPAALASQAVGVG